MYLGMSLVVDRQAKGVKDHEHVARSFMAADDVLVESELVHPAYGLKAMEAQIYKGRQPRKS